MLTTTPSKSQLVADHIEAEIRAGILSPGARMSGMRDLASRFNVSFTAVNHAYKILENKNMIVKKSRSGTIVNPKLAIEQTKLLALVTSIAYSDIENYYESLYSITGRRRIVPMTGLVRMEDNWWQIIKDIVARKPDYIMIDVEGRQFPLGELRSIIGAVPVCFCNRWEWVPEKPERAILTDYGAAYLKGLKELLGKGGERILIVVHHRHLQPYLKQRLDDATRLAGFRRNDPRLKTVSFEKMLEDPSAVRSEIEKFSPDSALGMNDYVLVRLEEICHDTAGIERIGFFDTVHSRRPGKEFSSFKINYDELWQNAIASFQDEKPVIRYVMPELVVRGR